MQPLDKLDWADLENSNLKQRMCWDLDYTVLLNKMLWWMELEGHGSSSVAVGELAKWETAVGQGLGTCGGEAGAYRSSVQQDLNSCLDQGALLPRATVTTHMVAGILEHCDVPH